MSFFFELPTPVKGALIAFLLLELVGRFAISRRLYKELLAIFFTMDVWALRLVQRIYPPRYVLLGSCQKRGTCCKQILSNPPDFIKRTRLLQVYSAFHQIVHNFEPVARGPDGEIIFRCNHLRTDGRCGIYRHRPLICRIYPVLPWFEPPKLLPGCGYRTAHRSVAPSIRLMPGEAPVQRRASLHILNASVAVHHPTPGPLTPPAWVYEEQGLPPPERTRRYDGEEYTEDFELFDDSK